ncbi:MAG TPA: hypothetical protein PLU49_01840 [Saprospiraceae bacterium]|nr:hypothetical protein [Saprospiraceae bacterium]
MKNNICFIVLMIFLTILSCNKDETLTISPLKETTKNAVVCNPDQVINNVVEQLSGEGFIIKYYLDNVEVSGITLDNNNDNWILWLGKLDENSNEVLEIRKFTTKNDYLTYGESLSIPVTKSVEFTDAMREYVSTNNIVEQFETYGTVPASYYEFETLTYNRYFNSNGGNRNIWVGLYDHCGPAGEGNSYIAMLKTYPFMPPSWNNRVSQVEIVGIYAGVSIFDKTFYRVYLGTVWGTGFNRKCLEGTTLDNKMSSGFQVL